MEIIFFGFLAVVAVLMAIGMVVAQNAVHSALFLVVNMFTIALLYLTLAAEFLAAVQIIVYAGAIMVLFLFVITLLNPAAERRMTDWRAQTLAGAALGIVLFVELAAIVWSGVLAGRPAAFPPPPIPPGTDNTLEIGLALFTTGFLLPFELTSVLLVVAIVGATVLAKGRLPVRRVVGERVLTPGEPVVPTARPEPAVPAATTGSSTEEERSPIAPGAAGRQS